MKDNIDKENIADFRSFNTFNSCISHFGFEFQFKKHLPMQSLRNSN